MADGTYDVVIVIKGHKVTIEASVGTFTQRKITDETKNLIPQRNLKMETRNKTPKDKIEIAELQKTVKK